MIRVVGKGRNERRKRRTGTSSRGDASFAEFEGLVVDLNGVWPCELGVSEENVDSVFFFEAFDGIVGTDLGSQPPHSLHDGGKVDLHVASHLDEKVFRMLFGISFSQSF